MSADKCIPELIAEGVLSGQRAKDAQRAYTRQLKRFEDKMSPEAAAAAASRAVIEDMDYAVARKKRRTLMSAAAQVRLIKEIDAGHAADPKSTPFAVVRGIVEKIELQSERIQFQAHARLRDFVERFRRDMIGGHHDKSGLVEVIDELHGKAAKNGNAKLFADAVRDTFESLRVRANRAGMDIGKLENYGVPHRHDTASVRLAGEAKWRAAIVPELAPEKMIDPQTGGAFTPERFDEFLSATFKNIREGGASDGSGMGRASKADSRSEHRYLMFKDGAAWMRYNSQFGSGNPFDAIMGHIGGMAKDIALLERFGPNPDASFQRMMSHAGALDAQSPKKRSGAATRTSSSQALTNKLWRYINGEFSMPVVADGAILGPLHDLAVKGLQGTRNLMTSAMLGRASISALTGDRGTAVLARHFNALPVMKEFSGLLGQLNPASAEGRAKAIRLGLGMRDASRSLGESSRFFMESNGAGWTSVLADNVLRLSGLNKVTEGGQRAFGLDYLATLASERKLAFDALPERRRLAFDRHGITPADWDIMRASPVDEDGGGAWMAYDLIEDQAVSDKMMDLVLAETRMAVQEADATVKAVLKGGRPGSLAGEFFATGTQFKSFAVGLLANHAQRIAYIGRTMGPGAAAAYGVSFLTAMTLTGAASIQLREISKGRDPKPMDGKFWLAAVMYGGALGIFADLLGGFTSDRDGSVAKTFAGPTINFVDDVASTTKKFRDDKPENDGRAADKMLRRYFPGVSLWQGNVAINRWWFDQMQEEIDPNYRADRRALERRTEEQGQEFYWAPGELSPDRAPDFANAIDFEGDE